MIAALLPLRRFMGLLWATAFAIVIGSILWLDLVIRSPSTAVETLSTVWMHCTALGIFAIAQGIRFLLGMGLVLPSAESHSRAPQFQIADLIEWTVSIGVFFGLGQLCGWFHDLRLLAMLITWQTAITLPMALTIVSRRGPSWIQVLLVVCLALLATVTDNVIRRHIFPELRWPSWTLVSQVLTLTASYLIATAVNLSIVRRIGFRWTTPPRHAQSTVN